MFESLMFFAGTLVFSLPGYLFHRSSMLLNEKYTPAWLPRLVLVTPRPLKLILSIALMIAGLHLLAEFAATSHMAVVLYFTLSAIIFVPMNVHCLWRLIGFKSEFEADWLGY